MKIITGKQFDGIAKLGIGEHHAFQMSTFGKYCHDNRSVDELIELYLQPASPRDCKKFDITEGEWRAGIRQALANHATLFIDV